MNRSLTAAALLVASHAALAQSSITLFGVVDATLAHGNGSVSSKTQLTNSGYNSSRLGFRGVEDLGGGMSASFWLEAGVANDDGSGVATNSNNQTTGVGAATAGRQGLTFNRRSTVSLAGNWGEIRLGRDYSPQFWNNSSFDPFGYNGVGITQLSGNLGGLTNARASNSVAYFLPELGGVYGQFQHWLGENNSGALTSDDGTGSGFRIGYQAGPFNAAVAYARTNYATGDITSANVGGTYNFGLARVSAVYDHDRVDAPVNISGRGYLLGVNAPIGAHEIRGSYSMYKTSAAGSPQARKLAVGYVHNLSKRTALYTTFAQVRNSGGSATALNGSVTAPNANSSGFDLGIRHAF